MSRRAEARLGARIRAVEAIPLRLPFRRAFTMAHASQPTREHVDVLVVRITSEDGRVGLGETQAWRRQGSGETLPSLFAKVKDIASPLLTGRSALEFGVLLSELEGRLAGNLYVQAAIGDALYDLAARSLDLPVHDLLGGRFREEIPVGLAIGISGDKGGMVEAAEEAVERGYRHIRIKIGLDPELDFQCATALRARFGHEIVLRADANGGMSYGDALRLLTRLEALDLDIVEQPVAGWDLDGMAALARAIRIPLSADESVTTAHSLAEVAKRGAARVFQSKTAKNGGLHYIRRLWTLAETLGIGIFPGNHPSTGLNVAAVAHLAAAWPGELLVGDFQTGLDDMIAEDILEEPVRIAGGKVAVPAGPGFGVKLDEAKLRKYRWE
jgi:L-alanine-DL-glutamate epimerase-like enolase superfamily enzyme